MSHKSLNIYNSKPSKQEILSHFDGHYINSLTTWGLRCLIENCRLQGIEGVVSQWEYEVQSFCYPHPLMG